MKRAWGAVCGAALLVSGCGGGGSGSDTASGGVTVVAANPTPSPTPAPSPTPSPTPAPSPTPSPTPTATSFAAQAAALYDVAPDPAACRAGTLKASVKADLLANLNTIRALHRLPAVTYSDVEDAAEAESSLMMTLARALSHTPPTSWACYTSAGAGAAGTSNLIGGWGSGLPFPTEDYYLASWLNEAGSAEIGHRRWLLSPFLGKVSYGRVTFQAASGDRASAGSLRVFNFATNPPVPSNLPAYVAYPFGDYPVRYFRPGDYLSFTVVAGTTGSFGANSAVRFTGASITVTGPTGALAVTDISSDNDGYGVANSVQWRVGGLQQGVTYTVRIAGVAGAPQSEYTYTFKVV